MPRHCAAHGFEPVLLGALLDASLSIYRRRGRAAVIIGYQARSYSVVTVAQSWRVRDQSHRRPRPPLDQAALERLALSYAERYATTRARLAAYLRRKLRERDWSGADPPALDSLVERFVALGYVDDQGFATARASALLRRGYGGRRIDQALRAAGISETDGEEARSQVQEGEFAAALRFARRKRLGPFAAGEGDHATRQKAFGAMVRAGHSIDTVRKVLCMQPDEIDEVDGF